MELLRLMDHVRQVECHVEFSSVRETVMMMIGRSLGRGFAVVIVIPSRRGTWCNG